MNNVEETIRSLMLAADPIVYIGDAPIDVDDCSWVRASGGTSQVHFDKETYDYPSYIVYTRGVNNVDAKYKINKIYDLLKNYVGQGFVILVRQLPRYTGRDQKHRAHYSIRVEYQLGGY